MRTFARSIVAAITVQLLAGCVAPSVPPARTGTAAPPTATRPAAPVPSMTPAPPTRGFIPPQIMRGPGLDLVIGSNATALVNRFGPPALNVAEGDARKLQFRGNRCVLDVYLYPLHPRAEPTATWIEARRPDNGRDLDRAECISMLRR